MTGPGEVPGDLAAGAQEEPGPRLSVIVSCRNGAGTLAETLEAIVGQDYRGWWELVVVDNGSTDATAAVAQRFAQRAGHFTLLLPARTGYQACGLNHGIRASHGEYLVFLDAGDVIAPGYLEQMASALGAAPLLGGALDVEQLNAPWLLGRRRVLQADRIDQFCGYLPAVVGASMAARREVIEAVDGFDESLPTQHDLDISWRLHEAGYPAAFVPGAVVHYRYRDTVRAIFGQELSYGEGEVALYRKFRAKGLRRRGIPHVLVDYARTVNALRGLRTPQGRARFATLLGANLGRLRGSIRFSVLYL